ncbi:hypothetical protein CVT24_009492 [Panaeolus cyanescens]|uniref:AMP-dependent synthetase/ligase domain-containing protein n=1 Tax=Panaeolus cyanescens TaxID=181874 RepID=A0A409VAG7_9AGAR|nr:hypothetical protein CVT24_009492 [Panaeolus cyanescens]
MSSSQWVPKLIDFDFTVDEIICAPGQMHELETVLIDGLVQRVYKNLWPSLRVFWLWAANEHKDLPYIVFEKQRLTFSQVFAQSLKAAAVFYDVYGVRKGDRVVICSRNYPSFLVAFWACHLIGAVSALANAWSPQDILRYCLTHTDAKLIVVDPERADRLEPIATALMAEIGCSGMLVLEHHEGKGEWKGMTAWDKAMQDYKGDPTKILKQDFKITPEDDATILFTSGSSRTTGLPKGVLSTQRQYLTNVLNVMVSGRRAALRRGEGIPVPVPGPQKGILIPVPLFHVTGLTSLSMLATLGGFRIVLMRKWIPELGEWSRAKYAHTNTQDIKSCTDIFRLFDRLIKDENVAVAGGVPSMVADLTDNSKGAPLEALMFGGAPAPDTLAARASKAFPTAALSQGYGLTETSSVAVGFAAEDYSARPQSCGLAMPINDILIMKDNKSVPTGSVGEVWLRGPNVMKGYWKDQAATDKVLTKDGWFKSGDLGYLDEEGFLYIRDRMKDIIIRGGENIDSVTVENVLYSDDRILEAAAVGVPDPRLGELVAAVVSIKPPYHGQVTEAQLIALAAKRLPKFAVPVMIIIQNEPFERTPSGKILKPQLRQLAAKEWVERAGQTSKVKL